MANEEQLEILRQGVDVWNKWRKENRDVDIDLNSADLSKASLAEADLRRASLIRANLRRTDLSDANLRGSYLSKSDLTRANLKRADLSGADLTLANLTKANLMGSNFAEVVVGSTVFVNSSLGGSVGLEDVAHWGPSSISTDVFALSKGKIPEVFLRGCGLPDWEIESVKLHDPELSNEDINKILYRIYDLRARQALQISPLFISYSHGDGTFVDKLENHLNKKGIRFWRDIHEAKAGRLETQVDRAIRQTSTVLLILSEHSLKSDWVEHEVRTARSVEKEMGRDILCPVSLDDSWKNSPWPERVMEQVMEYNILDFSAWKDESKFESTFNKLIDGLELFYKG
jgi:uncharacterized protein YjbI with pentapeptide repeats